MNEISDEQAHVFGVAHRLEAWVERQIILVTGLG